MHTRTTGCYTGAPRGATGACQRHVAHWSTAYLVFGLARVFGRLVVARLVVWPVVFEAMQAQEGILFFGRTR